MGKKINLTKVSLTLILITLSIILIVYVACSLFSKILFYHPVILLAFLVPLVLSIIFMKNNSSFSEDDKYIERAGKHFLVSFSFLILASLFTWFVIANYDPNVGGEGDPIILFLLLPMWILFPLYICFFAIGSGYLLRAWFQQKRTITTRLT
jgi:hypothetical protein